MFLTKFSPTRILAVSACSCLAVSTVALPFSLSLLTSSAQAQSRRVRYVPPTNLGTPIVSTPGITRSAGCTNEKFCLIGLVPDLEVKNSPVPLTISERPTIYFLIPEFDGEVSFTLWEDDIKLAKGKRIYRATFYLKSKAGIIAFKLPEYVQGLKLETNYAWEFSRVPRIGNLQDLKVIGTMRRVLPKQNLVTQLKEASQPIERAALFAQEGLWYETVQTLAEAMQDTPKDAEIVGEWNALLKSANLNRVLPHTFVKTNEARSESIVKPNKNNY
ncbi:DUF928 domain-containing protein [Pseudanabaena galeata UHCC 0370]|uniref:DUF928 domain-containing protein n=1 Tax=Pseudanabaena galeata UHCC 0370 TaxID=3110310 RepID=A0ABU5THE2_9CYAN|nr:DUF928 domain-containing protein [Pseudanabaena galeata]MEA5477630.1 DUF928 domain-containing protein [Pseudanabaena galeata UHCC 0370]